MPLKWSGRAPLDPLVGPPRSRVRVPLGPGIGSPPPSKYLQLAPSGPGLGSPGQDQR